MTYELCRHDQQPLIREVVLLIVVHPLHRNDIGLWSEIAVRFCSDARVENETYCIRRLVADARHDGDQHMFLDGEGAGVEGDAKDLDVGEEAGPEAAEGEGQQLGDNLWRARERPRSDLTPGCAVGTGRGRTPETVTEG